MPTGEPDMSFIEPDAKGSLIVRLSGDWKLGRKIPSSGDAIEQVEFGTQIKQIGFDTQQLGAWDSGLLTFLIQVINQCNQRKIRVKKDGLPKGVQRLVELATAVPEKKDTGKGAGCEPFLERIGSSALSSVRSVDEMFVFIGETRNNCNIHISPVFANILFYPLVKSLLAPHFIMNFFCTINRNMKENVLPIR